MASSNDIARHLRAGVTRVRDVDGFVGTVMYVGSVPSAKNSQEIYAGIAWDDASRGKHDGSVICRTTNQLVRLFHCQGGSFLRLSKVDLGVTLNPALMQSKYVGMDAPVVAPNNVLPHTARTAGGRDKPIEFLGEMNIRKRQQLSDLDKISLRSLGISRACTDESMVEFHHLKEIDLAGNLLSDWDTVFTILGQFPLLQDVSLASNRILDIPPELSQSPVSLDRIRILNLNGCSLKFFRTVQWIADAMPHLEELCVSYNDLSDVTQVRGFDNLCFLDCSSCNLTSWKDQVQCFGQLPALEHLMLNDNDIADLSMDTVDCTFFEKLTSLQLAGTSIASWQDLDGIRCFQNLTSLRFRNTPLTSSMGAGEARSITVARIQSLTYLNASPISTKERIEAERRYVSSVARELLLVDEKKPVLALHPLFQQLAQLHKDFMAASATTVGGGSATQPVNVTIRSMAADSCSMEALQKRLPSGLKVGRLKAMCLRSFGLDTERQLLHAKREQVRTKVYKRVKLRYFIRAHSVQWYATPFFRTMRFQPS